MIREWFLRKKFWITDFLNGGRMWKEYKNALYIIKNQEFNQLGG